MYGGSSVERGEPAQYLGSKLPSVQRLVRWVGKHCRCPSSEPSIEPQTDEQGRGNRDDAKSLSYFIGVLCHGRYAPKSGLSAIGNSQERNTCPNGISD